MRHPVLSDRTRLIIWWLAWLFLTSGQLLLYYYAYGRFDNFFIADGIVSLVVFSGIGLSLWYPFKYFNTGKSQATGVIANIVLSGVFSVALWILITRYVMLLVVADKDEFLLYWEATIPYRTGTGVFCYGLMVLAYYLFISLYHLSEKNAKEARLESLVRETELKMLRSQINPHFLFNSLNSVSSLTITDPDKARDMVIKLSEFMRYALSKKDEQPVTLRSELENLRLYLEIEKVRFGDKLTTEEEINESCLEAMMPVMLLQPLYENAVKHGVYESTESVRIKTEVSCNKGYLEIIISNNYDPALSPKKGTGTGLVNVSRRLDLFYGNKASMQAKKENGIFSVTLFLPFEMQ